MTEIRLYDLIDELATDGIISINEAVRPFSRKQVADLLQQADDKQDMLNNRQRQDIAFYLNELALERDTMPKQYVQYTDNRTFNLSLCDPQFAYMTKDKIFKKQIKPILGMDIIA